MSRQEVISLRNVTKDYFLRTSAGAGLKESILHLPAYIANGRRRTKVRALDNISLSVRAGECLGIIGPNGSGKSTTLGLIAGVLKATTGVIRTRGRICPLLELGAGFHPDLTGRENIMLNGVLLGMKYREVRRRMERIIAFSELGSFIDHPIRVYSSGMIVRLGFSVAVHLDPEILLIDEVLAVGDQDFQAKCAEKMKEFRSLGVTMVFVSHSLPEVERACDRVALLEGGRLAGTGKPGEIISQYRGHLEQARPGDQAT